MQMIKRIIRKIIYKENAFSDTLLEYLRKHGAQIGDDVTVYAPNKTLIDKTTPYLLKIGNHVRITEGGFQNLKIPHPNPRLHYFQIIQFWR